MKQLIIALAKKYRELIIYGIFGVATTLVNFVCYYLLARLGSLSELPATAIAFFLSIIFAYFTNRKWVFCSKVRGKAQLLEFASFTTARLSGLVLDLAIMWIFVTKLGLFDLVIKILSNIFIIIFNYVVSKFLVFRKPKADDEEKETVEKEKREKAE